MKRLLTVLAVLSLIVTGVTAQSKVFTKPITIVCSFAAGGGTDQINRALAEGMKEVLGVNVNVVNMAGAGGGIAMEYVMGKSRDGYTILGCSETNLFAPANGATKHTTAKWDYFWVGGSPGVVLVPKDSKYKTFDDLIADIKARPGAVKVAASAIPGVWSIRWTAIMDGLGLKTKIIPFAGSNPSITAGLTGEVDVVHVSAGETLQYMQAGQMRPLIATELEAIEIPKVGSVPAIAASYPEVKKFLPMPQLLGVAFPSDTPKAIKDELNRAFIAAMKTDAVTKILASQLAQPFGLSGDAAKTLSKKMESKFSWLMVDLKVSKVDPATLGIAKP